MLTEVVLPNHRASYTMLMWQVKYKSWNPVTSILQEGLKTTFLQAENLSEVVFVTKPEDDGASSEEDRLLIDSMFSKERVPMARAIMTRYGTRDASANLDMAVRESLHHKGFQETLTCPNLYRRDRGEILRSDENVRKRSIRRSCERSGVGFLGVCLR